MKNQCDLVYVKEDIDDDLNPFNVETKKTVKCDDIGQWSSRYYEDRNRDMMISRNLRISRSYLDSCHGQLRYIEYKCVRYEVKQILNDKQRKMKCILDIEEYKA